MYERLVQGKVHRPLMGRKGQCSRLRKSACWFGNVLDQIVSWLNMIWPRILATLVESAAIPGSILGDHIRLTRFTLQSGDRKCKVTSERSSPVLLPPSSLSSLTLSPEGQREKARVIKMDRRLRKRKEGRGNVLYLPPFPSPLQGIFCLNDWGCLLSHLKLAQVTSKSFQGSSVVWY